MRISEIQIKKINEDFTVCKVHDFSQVNLESEFIFIGKTDEEKSVVCLTKDAPDNTTDREDGWRAFRIEGLLDFSLTGILAKIASHLAEKNIPIFAISTFNTDYVLVKAEYEMEALSVLGQAEYQIVTGESAC